VCREACTQQPEASHHPQNNIQSSSQVVHALLDPPSKPHPENQQVQASWKKHSTQNLLKTKMKSFRNVSKLHYQPLVRKNLKVLA